MGPAGLVLPWRQQAAAARWIDRLRVRCRDARQAARELSGGNQQKVALARLLHHDVDVLLLDEPTRGIDVGSKAEIYALIDELALAGKAMLIVTSYLPELLGVCDRIAVMRRGRLGAARAGRRAHRARRAHGGHRTGMTHSSRASIGRGSPATAGSAPSSPRRAVPRVLGARARLVPHRRQPAHDDPPDDRGRHRRPRDDDGRDPGRDRSVGRLDRGASPPS